MASQPLDIAALRERLEGKGGKAYWRGLEEVAETKAFKEYLHREFPEGAAEWKDSEGRRHFLKIMGASIALAGLGGCNIEPGEEIIPYVEAPEEIVPGEPLFYATAFPLGGYGYGVLTESHMGRPTKVEGNPDHPASMGATNAIMQASVLGLYDPDRSTNVMNRGTVSTWDDFARAMAQERSQLHRTQGNGLRILTGTVTSPTLQDQIRTLLEEMPRARWHQFDPTSRRAVHEGVRARLGQPGEPLYHFDEVEVIFSVGSDFLLMMPGSVRYARAFAERRRVRLDETEMNRLFAVESTPTITGAMADHRLPLPPSRLRAFVQSVAHELGVAPEPDVAFSNVAEAWKEALVAELQEHRGSSLVVPGEAHPPEVHELAHAMNEALGNVGTTVEFIEPVEARPENPDSSLGRLVEDIRAGEVETLLMLGGNPVYTAPQDIEFVQALDQVPQSIHLSKYVDETSYRSTWHLPRTHYMETWSDVRAFDGTASIIQPLIKPLYDPCRSAHEVLSVFTEGAMRRSYDIVTTYWRARYDGEDFALFWQRALHDGVVPGTGRMEGLPPHTIPGLVGLGPPDEEAAPEDTSRVDVDLAPADTTRADLPVQQPDTGAARPAPVTTPPAPEEDELEIIFRPSPMLRGGEFANNAWLQELPKPITKLSWDNAALTSPSTASRLGLENQDVVDMTYRGNSVRAAVWIVPGHADDCVTAYLGCGRERAGRVGDGVGFNAYRLRTSDQPWSGRGLTLQKIEDQEYSLATTQSHHSMEGRHLVREGTIGEFRNNPEFVTEGDPINLPSLYEEYEYDGYKWGMVIDTNVCIGCQACVVACQSENNIPVVGKEEVRRSREMHWIRVDRYYKGDLDNPDAYFQPVPCMHCEKAPCEVVCPVYATVHNEEGLNLMIYNRCIGTRYCSNNCPYKVRRFNFLQYAEWEDPDSLKGRRNPDVTVRSRGVMEKCTYCIQRISAARIQAKKEERQIRDGEVLTACQQACPTQAIVFGDLNDETARVKHLEKEPHNYALLEELGTRPRTTYLAHFRNPNEDLEKQFERESTERGLSPEVGPTD